MKKKEYKIKIWFEKSSKLYVISADKKDRMDFVVTQGKTFIKAFEMLGEAIKLMEDENE